MDLDSYVRQPETVYHRTSATREEKRQTGELAVTDTRLIYLKSGVWSDVRVLDVDLSRVDAVEHHLKPINWLYVLIGVIFISGAAFLYLLTPLFDAVPNLFRYIGGLSGLLMAVGFLIDAFYPRKQKLIIRTPSGTYVFLGGNFEEFPHAIRANG